MPGQRRLFAVVALLLSIVAVTTATQIPSGLDAYMPIPENNPQTREKTALGRTLFFDRRLSADGSVSCASCHDPSRAFADSARVSIGVFGRTGTRNAPALINRGYGAAFFWDGRAATLEEQVLGPIENPLELGARAGDVVARLARDATYAREFRVVFERDVSTEDLARALASYVRSILSGDAPIDRYLAGDRTALSAEAQAGLKVFRGKGNCAACHLGPTFSDERFHNTGVAWTTGGLRDPGRATVTGKAEDRGAFKTPTLRHVADTAPYMHDGSLARLDDVLAFYDRGGHPNPHLDAEIRPLRLTSSETAALLAFLRSLSGRITR